jgi:hypothetical protein
MSWCLCWRQEEFIRYSESNWHKGGRVLASYDYELPLGPDIQYLLKTGAKRRVQAHRFDGLDLVSCIVRFVLDTNSGNSISLQSRSFRDASGMLMFYLTVWDL